MKAIILASGTGSRLLPLTKALPKSLLKIDGETILDVEITNLFDCGINDMIVTTGFHAEKIKTHIHKKFPHVNVRYVHNEKYDVTNNIYSLWLTREFVDDDVLLLHGDMVFERELLHKLIMSEFSSAVLVNCAIETPGKDFQTRIADGKVKAIRVGSGGTKTCFCAPVYKLSQAAFQTWLNQIDIFVRDGQVTCYAEDALNTVADDIGLRPVYYEDEFCMEIDTLDDLETAKTYYKNNNKEI